VGTQWLLDGRAWRIIRQLAPDRFVAQDVKFHVEQEFSQQEIHSHYAEGRLRFEGEPTASATKNHPSAKSTSVRHLTAQQRRVMERRWQAIEPLTKLPGTPREEDYQQRSTELRRRRIRFSTRTLRRYFQAWHKAGKHRLALVPRTARSGGRGRSRRNGLAQRHPVLRQLMEEAINTVYLNKARRPISAVSRRVLEDLQRHNTRLSSQQAIPVPREAALARAIARRIAQLDPWEVDRQRWGRKIADSRHAFKRTRQLATRILERVEIDHTPLKVVVGTKAGPIGQPCLTILIDYYSRLIVGFCLGFEPPSYAVIMEALRNMILPKTYLKERYPRVQGEWPCCGLPEKLVCDRGSDLTSKDLEGAAFQLGIELDFNPPRTPHLKGTVESFFDSLNDQLASSLPGRTFRSWEKRADYKPDEGPFLTYEGLLEVIHIHLVDVYSIAKHPTSSTTRIEMWQDSAAVHPPSLPASAEELLVLLARRAERTLTVRGIELGGMFYASDELMALRAELAAGNHRVDRLAIRYNPWDLGAVWVVSPIDGSFLQADAIDSVMKGMTEYQWKVLKRAIRERFDQPEHLMNLAAGRNAIRDVVEEALQKPSRRRRSRVMRHLQGGSSATDEPAESPMADAVAPNQEDHPASEMSSVEEQPPASPAAPIDSEDIDVSDWEVAGPDV
jgi:putative transposase